MNTKNRHQIYIEFFKKYTRYSYQSFKLIGSENVQRKVINFWKSLSWEERIEKVIDQNYQESKDRSLQSIKKNPEILCTPETLWKISGGISNSINIFEVKVAIQLEQKNKGKSKKQDDIKFNQLKPEDDIFAEMGKNQKLKNDEKKQGVRHQYLEFFKAKFEEYKNNPSLTNNEITQRIALEWKNIKEKQQMPIIDKKQPQLQKTKKMIKNIEKQNIMLTKQEPNNEKSACSEYEDEMLQKLKNAKFFIPITDNVQIELKGSIILEAILQNTTNGSVIDLDLAFEEDDLNQDKQKNNLKKEHDSNDQIFETIKKDFKQIKKVKTEIENGDRINGRENEKDKSSSLDRLLHQMINNHSDQISNSNSDYVSQNSYSNHLVGADFSS